MKVKDLMMTENLPIVSQKTPLKEAIITMSEGRLGNVLITDEDNKLLAILSDGAI